MYISIIGSQGCGKTTLFHAFSGRGVIDGKHGLQTAVIEVPDVRLDRLTAIFNPRKTVYGRIEVCDTEPIRKGDMKKEAMSSQQVQHMRESDALLLVLKNFGDASPSDAVSDFHTMLTELIVCDMVQIETRLERIKKQSARKGQPRLEQEREGLEQCLAHLADGNPLTTLSLFSLDGSSLKGFQFLSRKPLMAVLNCSEALMKEGGRAREQFASKLPHGVPCIQTCSALEAELAVMDPEDREVFMAEYGVAESLRSRLIRVAFQTLGLISFLTVGEDECRVWPIRKGICAQEAAGVIHSDLAEKFIRAETVAYEDFIKYGDIAACRKAGVWRLEGKNYIVQDGDMLSIRAGN